jgi:hypothetical protein
MDTYGRERDLPEEEKHSTGRMGGGTVMLAAVVAALVLGVVLYGVNAGGRSEQATAQSTHPRAGGNSGAANPGPPRANESGVKG